MDTMFSDSKQSKAFEIPALKALFDRPEAGLCASAPDENLLKEEELY